MCTEHFRHYVVTASYPEVSLLKNNGRTREEGNAKEGEAFLSSSRGPSRFALVTSHSSCPPLPDLCSSQVASRELDREVK